MQIGYTVIQRATAIEVQITAPENNEQRALVTYARSGDSFALFIGHLYYKDVLYAKIIAQDDKLSLNDAELALAVYRSLGLAALEQLEGDFALLIWDAEREQLIGLRDPLGGYPLFWMQHGDMLAFSTSIRPLCALMPRCLLNEEYCAEFVMLQAPRNEGANEQCAYRGIHRVLPGTMVIARGNMIERRAYWDWLEQIRDPGTSDLAEVAEQYRELLRAAVRERIHGCTLAHLSGGMDSTSIALVACEVIHPNHSLHTASLVYERLPLLARERPYLESVLEKLSLEEKKMIAHFLPADDLLQFDNFLDPPLHDEPYTALASLSTDQPIMALAAEIGALTILTGHGADEIHHLLPYYLADLLRQRHFRKAWQETVKWAKSRNCSPWSIMRTFAINPLISTWIAGSRWAGLATPKDADWSIPAWIRPDFARRHALRNRALENAQQIYQQCEQTSLSITLSSIANRVGDVYRWAVAAPLGIAHAHPFLDPRLLSFGLGMQQRIFPDPGQMKPVLSEAMRGTLPDKIRDRQRKGHFNEVYYLGLARNLPHLEATIRQAPAEEMIDKDLMIQHLREGSLAGVPVRQLQHLNYMLSLLKWLCMQEKWLHMQDQATITFQVQRMQ